MTRNPNTRKNTARNIGTSRYNIRERKVHLDPGWEGGNFSSLEMSAYRESKGMGEGDAHSIDDPDYDLLEALSREGFSQTH